MSVIFHEVFQTAAEGGKERPLKNGASMQALLTENKQREGSPSPSASSCDTWLSEDTAAPVIQEALQSKGGEDLQLLSALGLPANTREANASLIVSRNQATQVPHELLSV